MEPKLELVTELISRGFSVKIQAGTPDRDELRRLLDVRDAINSDRDQATCVRNSIEKSCEDFDLYRRQTPVLKPQIRSVFTKKLNQCIASLRVTELRQDIQAHAAQIGDLLETCNSSIDELEERMINGDDDEAVGVPPAAEDPPKTAEGVDGATAKPTSEAAADATKQPPKTSESTRTAADDPLKTDKEPTSRPADDVTKEFGDTTWPFASGGLTHGRSGGTPPPLSSDRARPPSPRRAGGTLPPSRAGTSGSIFGPLRAEIAASSTHSTRAPSTPLAFTAEGKPNSLLPTTDTGPDFSLYGSNPFYLHSLVKLPIASDIIYDSATKTPVLSQVQLKPLDPPAFNGVIVYWPQFRDDFIRLVHAPGRYLSDADRLRYLKQALHQSLTTHAAVASLEESTDGPMKPSNEMTTGPAESSGQSAADAPKNDARKAQPQLLPASGQGGSSKAQCAQDLPKTNSGHESDAPTEPETDSEYDYDYDDTAPLDGVGIFGAAVPSGAELCRTHLLECITAKVFNPDDPTRQKTATVFFDCGSSKTSDQPRKEALSLDTFANDTSVKLDTFDTHLGLVTTKGRRQRTVIDAAASQKVVRELHTAFISEKDVPQLRRNNCILVPECVAPDVVIGRDTLHHFRKKDILPLLPSGFCLGTPWRQISPLFGSFFATDTGAEASHLEQMAENFWKTENIGIEPNTQTPDDQLAHERFKQTTSIDEEGRYQCRLPWKTTNGLPISNVALPTYHAVARGRQTSFQRAHQHEPEFLLKYGEGFTTMEQDGIIERFVPTERNSALLHFLAHHAVIKESSATTKVRHVFDGSNKLSGKPSINDLLHRGPVLLPKMAAILVRTRLSQILLIADIAKMLLRQFASNCSQFNAQLPPEDAAELRHLMNLGYEWDVASDCWRISLASRPAKGKPKGRKRRREAE